MKQAAKPDALEGNVQGHDREVATIVEAIGSLMPPSNQPQGGNMDSHLLQARDIDMKQVAVPIEPINP